MSHDKRLALLGFCRKAGKLVVGTRKVTDLVKTGGHCLVILAEDISQKTEKELAYHARNGHAVILRLPCPIEQVAHATGTTAGVFATADEGFCKAILQGGNS